MNRNTRFSLMCSLIAAIALATSPACRSAEPPTRRASQPETRELPQVTIHTQSGAAHTVSVELALTGEERTRGLMHRKELAENAGMLFFMEREDVHAFWMKNTLIPLDMLFLDPSGIVVGIVESAEPKTLTPRSVDAVSLYVLELAGGYCQKNGVHPGDRVDLAEARRRASR